MLHMIWPWLFDKLGYMPKINMQVGKVNAEVLKEWPFPVVEIKTLSEKPKKPTVKKTRPLPSKATVAKTARTKKK